MTAPRRRVTIAVIVLALLVVGAQQVLTRRTVIRPAYDRDGVLVVLVIGSDAGWPYRPGDPLRGLADAVHLVAVDPARRTATVVDIPRDSVIGGTKVNAHLSEGGPQALVAQLESYTDLTIDYWVLTTFRGLEDLTRDIGGVEVQVDRPMHDPSSGSDFEPGRVRLRGPEALAYARDRHSLSDGDFGRTRHQGDMLLAMHRRLVDVAGRLPAVVDLLGTVARTTASNIPRSQLLPLALLAADIAPDDVAHVPLEGSLGTQAGASVVQLHPGDAFTRVRDGDVAPSRQP